MNAPEIVRPSEQPDHAGARDDRRIGGILVGEGKLEADDIERVLERQRRDGSRFGESALRLGLIDKDDIREAIARQYDLVDLLPGSESRSQELVAAHAPFHRRAEELRALRTQLSIRWSNADVRHRVLAVVSPGRREGRSYVAANLAVMFSQLGERTLLIDANLRTPRLHRIFNVPDQAGLAAVLSGRANGDAVIPVSTFGRLSLLPAGVPPPNPQELLSGVALGKFLQDMRNEFDVILFDTPAARLYADAQSVAYLAGSALMLVRQEHTRLEDANGVIRELNETGARVIGTVINAF